MPHQFNELEKEVIVTGGDILLPAILAVPENPKSVIVFAHGSGSGRYSPRNNSVARTLQAHGHATLLMDLLSEEEAQDRSQVFDIDLLSDRLNLAKVWLRLQHETKDLQIGYFGASTGAAAALMAAAQDPQNIYAVISRGGRPDLAGSSLAQVEAPTLLLVGEQDDMVLQLNRRALKALLCIKELKIIPGATHLFEESGTLEEVSELAAEWFDQFSVQKLEHHIQL